MLLPTEAGSARKVPARQAEALLRPGRSPERVSAEAKGGAAWTVGLQSGRDRPGPSASAPAGAVAAGFVDGQIRQAAPSPRHSGGMRGEIEAHPQPEALRPDSRLQPRTTTRLRGVQRARIQARSPRRKATQPAVGCRGLRQTCRKIALPRPCTAGCRFQSSTATRSYFGSPRRSASWRNRCGRAPARCSPDPRDRPTSRRAGRSARAHPSQPGNPVRTPAAPPPSGAARRRDPVALAALLADPAPPDGAGKPPPAKRAPHGRPRDRGLKAGARSSPPWCRDSRR